ncbi:MAG: exodeoxyribonuclease V subunit gamma [Propionicimonas sp.]
MNEPLNRPGALPGLRYHRVATAENLVAALLSCWSSQAADPFAFDLAVVPGPGFQRWLSQQLASSGDGAEVCAGIEFVSGEAWLNRLVGPDEPWSPDRLAWLLVEISGTADEPGLQQLRLHLAASREPWTACHRIARQFADYADYRPEMLAAWAVGNDVGPTGAPLSEEAWQASLWRATAARIGYHPLESRHRLLERLRAAPAPGIPARVAVLAPRRLSGGNVPLFEALASWHQVDLLIPAHSPGRLAGPGNGAPQRRSESSVIAGHPLNESLATVSDELTSWVPSPAAVPAPTPARPATLLGWLQQDLADDAHPRPHVLEPDDRSVQVHLSHGLDRQVEVLREVLAGQFDRNPSLEPRDVVVITPQVDDVASLISAAFGLAAAPGRHPGHGFRLQVADRSLAQVNPMVTLLLELLRLPDGRVEASRLVDLCAQEPVARQFGFTSDSHDRLVRLVQQAGIRWGLSAAQRQVYGLGMLPQNTWLAGVQRMLLGVALSEQDLVSVRTVLPLDDVESSDVELIGGLTELVGRLSRLFAEWDRPTTLAGWVERCRRGLASLVEVAPDDEWQLGDLWTGLARIAARDDQGRTILNRHGAIRAVEEEFRGSPARGAFGNGSAIVCGPASLRHVPHRVVILLGWDADRYPRPGRRHGDDLLGLAPLVGDPSTTLDDRQVLLDALHAVRQTLIVIARGRSEATNEEVPLAAPIQELLDALNDTATTRDGKPAGLAVTAQHPLQPFDAKYFDPTVAGGHAPVISYDPIAFAGAKAAREPQVALAGRYRLATLAPPDLSGGVGLDDLTGFFVHPARALLRQRAGLSMGESPVAPESIPIELDGLQRWQIGTRMLRDLRAGRDASELQVAERLRGGVPPAELGRSTLRRVLNEAQATLDVLPAAAHEPSVVHDLHCLIAMPGGADVSLTGRVATQAGSLMAVEFSSLQPKHRIAAWLRLLALAAAKPGQWRAIAIGRGYARTLTAPPAAESRALLGRYLSLYSLGLTRSLPAMPRVCEAWATLRARGYDPAEPKVGRAELRRCWNWDSDAAWAVFYGTLDDALAERTSQVAWPEPTPAEASLVGALAQLIWAPLLSHERSGAR